MPFTKGASGNPAGKPKGARGKIGLEIKEAITEALKAVGGKDYLIGLAKTNPQVFCALVSKIIPAEVDVTVRSPFEDMDTNELIALAGTVHAAAIGSNAESGSAEGTGLPPSGSVPAVH